MNRSAIVYISCSLKNNETYQIHSQSMIKQQVPIFLFLEIKSHSDLRRGANIRLILYKEMKAKVAWGPGKSWPPSRTYFNIVALGVVSFSLRSLPRNSSCQPLYSPGEFLINTDAHAQYLSEFKSEFSSISLICHPGEGH